MKLFSAIIKHQEYRTRRDALVQLRAMTDRALIDCNFSPELVKEGVKAWPWQIPPEEVGRLSFECIPSVADHCTEAAVDKSQQQEQKAHPVFAVQRNAA